MTPKYSKCEHYQRQLGGHFLFEHFDGKKDYQIKSQDSTCPFCKPVEPKKHNLFPIPNSGIGANSFYKCERCKDEKHLDHFERFPFCKPARLDGVKELIEKKIRNDYKGVIGEAQIQATIDWWNNLAKDLTSEHEAAMKVERDNTEAARFNYERALENFKKKCEQVQALESALKAKEEKLKFALDAYNRIDSTDKRLFAEQSDKINALQADVRYWKYHYYNDDDKGRKISELENMLKMKQDDWMKFCREVDALKSHIEDQDAQIAAAKEFELKESEINRKALARIAELEAMDHIILLARSCLVFFWKSDHYSNFLRGCCFKS